MWSTTKCIIIIKKQLFPSKKRISSKLRPVDRAFTDKAELYMRKTKSRIRTRGLIFDLVPSRLHLI